MCMRHGSLSCEYLSVPGKTGCFLVLIQSRASSKENVISVEVPETIKQANVSLIDPQRCTNIKTTSTPQNAGISLGFSFFLFFFFLKISSTTFFFFFGDLPFGSVYERSAPATAELRMGLEEVG